MTLATFPVVLAERRDRSAAVGAFTCYDLTMAFGVLRAAERRGAPVILLVSVATFSAREGQSFVAALDAIARRSSVPVCVQLDHASDEALIIRALECGVGAVMADASRLPLVENTAFVRNVRQAVSSANAGIEVELGHIEGGEDVAAAIEAGALTDPDEAAAFVDDLRPDCLAVSIGNVHGTYAGAPRLDWARLERIRTAVGELPLSLHGASGLSDDDVRRAIALGICKVNVNTEIRARYIAELESRLPQVKQGFRVLELETALVDAVAEVVDAKLQLIAGGEHAPSS